MLKQEDNERLVRVGSGMPMGELLRRYWHPALMSRELVEPDGAPVRVRLLCEDLIAFRDTDGRVGLVDAYCAHRRAPLFYGRNEACGIRCVYHGWKFDVSGNCVDLPSEPADSPMREKVKLKSYPTYEKAGVIWVYMGPAEHTPPLPDFEWMRAPETHRFVSKSLHECNYLQALEGGLDSAHVTFLHNERLDRVNPVTHDGAPKLDVYPTDYGYTYTSDRKMSDDSRYLRVYHYIMPVQQMRGDTTPRGVFDEVPKFDGHFWVPIDDEHTWTWNWMYGYDQNAVITPELAMKSEKRAGRGEDDFIPGTLALKRNRSNDHLIDRQRQKTTSFTGVTGIATQDMAITEGMGPIVDRTREYLGTTDKAVIAMRKMLLDATYAVERGEAPPGLDPEKHRNIRPVDRVIPGNADLREALAEELVAKW